MSNIWDKSKTYRLRDFDIVIAKARPTDPVYWYLECHRKDGGYYASYGSEAIFRRIAVIKFIFKLHRGDFS